MYVNITVHVLNNVRQERLVIFFRKSLTLDDKGVIVTVVFNIDQLSTADYAFHQFVSTTTNIAKQKALATLIDFVVTTNKNIEVKTKEVKVSDHEAINIQILREIYKVIIYSKNKFCSK